MPALTNPRHERFAHEVASGKSASEAYVAAGFKPARQNAHALLRRDDVSLRVNELQAAARALEAEATAKACERLSITKERILAELAKIAFSDLREAVSWRGNVTVIGEDPDTGEPQTRAFNEVALVDSHKLSDDIAGAIAEVSQSKEGALKLKLYDKKGALVDLGKHLGLFIDGAVNVNVTNVVKREPMTPEGWAERHNAERSETHH